MFDLEKVINNFKIIPSNKTNNILLDNMNNMGSKNILYVFAGPNGSGKSTLVANFYNQGFFDNVKYLNADIFAKTLFNNILNDKEKNIKAMEYTINKINNNMKSGDSVIYETVLSHPSKLDIIKAYKKHGYQIISVFVSPCNPEINIERVEQRVREGGHNVPKEKIVDRFYKSNGFKKSLMELSDVYYCVDNTFVPKITHIAMKNFDMINDDVDKDNSL